MQSTFTASLFVFSLALAPVAGTILEQSCNGCNVSGSIPQANGTTVSLLDGDTFTTNNINDQEPASASGSWDFNIINPGALEINDGICGPLTPGPGCYGTTCTLVCTDTFVVELRDKQPSGGGTTGPTPGPGWGAENNHKWTWEMSKDEVTQIDCSTEEDTPFDLSIAWKHAGAPKSYDFKFGCSQCIASDGE